MGRWIVLLVGVLGFWGMLPAATLEQHLIADNCEIFVDKFAVRLASYGHKGLDAYIKVLPERLDAPIAEVGFRGICYGESGDGGIECDHQWQNVVLEDWLHSGDYFKASWDIVSWQTYGMLHEGVFFVKTQAGTYYWAKRGPHGENFYFDNDFLAELMEEYSINQIYHTQEERLRDYNWNQCY